MNGTRRARRIALLGLVALGVVGAWGFDRCEVDGASMLPTFQPGDRLLLHRRRPGAPLKVGALVAFDDPRPGETRLLVKRVAAVAGNTVTVLGDNPAASTDSRTFGPIPLEAITWAVTRRYGRSADMAHAR
jgi:nickel-type superoxide dismutase maturation protease